MILFELIWLTWHYLLGLAKLPMVNCLLYKLTFLWLIKPFLVEMSTDTFMNWITSRSMCWKSWLPVHAVLTVFGECVGVTKVAWEWAPNLIIVGVLIRKGRRQSQKERPSEETERKRTVAYLQAETSRRKPTLWRLHMDFHLQNSKISVI